MRELTRMGLVLRSEAQWEYGCRAGTDTPWHFGGERDAIRGRVNIADRSVTDENWPAIGEWPEHENGGLYHREVGAYPANAWGLHEVHGNLWESCQDGSYDYDRMRPVDPIAPWEGAEFRIYRGGSFGGAPLRLARPCVRKTCPCARATLSACGRQTRLG